MDTLSNARSPADSMEAVPFSTSLAQAGAQRMPWTDTKLDAHRQEAETHDPAAEKLLMESFAEEISRSLNSFASLQFNRDEGMKKLMVHVVEKESDTLIRQISGEKMLMMVQHMRELEELILGSE
ncbi:MAG: flagellar protein FlaG [Magnetococcales bacterium]|nr:flagellar protein FlaG [Magnetococcales bacterium]